MASWNDCAREQAGASAVREGREEELVVVVVAVLVGRLFACDSSQRTAWRCFLAASSSVGTLSSGSCSARACHALNRSPAALLGFPLSNERTYRRLSEGLPVRGEQEPAELRKAQLLKGSIGWRARRARSESRDELRARRRRVRSVGVLPASRGDYLSQQPCPHEFSIPRFVTAVLLAPSRRALPPRRSGSERQRGV